MTADETQVGPEIEGYEYLARLGAGGQAKVFRYREKKLHREVAIKVLNVGASEDEARTMALVSGHSSIVDVYDVGTTAAGVGYIVMKLYTKRSLATLIKEGPTSLEAVLQYGIQLCGAVEWAHRNGVLHRDIKPGNVLIDAAGLPGLTDFGISSRDNTAVQTNVSAYWAAPEALEQRPSNELSDVYSLAATLYHLYERRAPHEDANGNADTNSRKRVAQRAVIADAFEVTRPGTPESFRVLMKQSLARDPMLRPRTAEAFGRRLQAIEQELGFAQTAIVIPNADRDAWHAPVMTAHDDIIDALTDNADATEISAVRVIDADRTDLTSAVIGDESAWRTELVGNVLAEMIEFSPVGIPTYQAGGRRVHRLETPKYDVPGVSDEANAAGDAAPPKRRKGLIVAALIAVGAAVGAIAVVGGRGNDDGTAQPQSDAYADLNPSAVVVPRVGDLRLERVDANVVAARWSPVEGADYSVRRCDLPDSAPLDTATPEVLVENVPEGTSICVAVFARIGRSISDEQRVSGP